ncbi:hypothetical protein BaRGS_00000844, partial [Batillaria attramentaria]
GVESLCPFGQHELVDHVRLASVRLVKRPEAFQAPRHPRITSVAPRCGIAFGIPGAGVQARNQDVRKKEGNVKPRCLPHSSACTWSETPTTKPSRLRYEILWSNCPGRHVHGVAER